MQLSFTTSDFIWILSNPLDSNYTEDYFLLTPYDSEMAFYFSIFWARIFLLSVLTASFVLSQENQGFPQPKLTFTSPKSSLLQITLEVPGYAKDVKYEVKAHIFSEGHNPLKDAPLKEFTCGNDNYNDGLCTIYGLSAGTKYSITVRACDASDASACSQATGTYTTPKESNLPNFGLIIMGFLFFMIVLCAVMNYDLVIEMYKTCRKSIMRRDNNLLSTSDSEQPDSVQMNGPGDIALAPILTEVNREELPEKSTAPTTPVVVPNHNDRESTSSATSHAKDNEAYETELQHHGQQQRHGHDQQQPQQEQQQQEQEQDHQQKQEEQGLQQEHLQKQQKQEQHQDHQQQPQEQEQQQDHQQKQQEQEQKQQKQEQQQDHQQRQQEQEHEQQQQEQPQQQPPSQAPESPPANHPPPSYPSAFDDATAVTDDANKDDLLTEHL